MKGKEAPQLTLSEAHKIRNSSERVFAIAVLSIPHLTVCREPAMFELNGEKTLPDFLVINQKSGEKVYVEVTWISKSQAPHRKKIQRDVMEGNGTHYVQLFGEEIDNIRNSLKRRNIDYSYVLA